MTPATEPEPDPGAEASGRWAHGLAAPVLVFCTSAIVLVLEILAGRLVAPYVGVSLETYTGIIGTVLAGIAAGSALGGWAADRYDPRSLLGPLLMASGGASLLSLPAIAAFGPVVAADGGGPDGIVLLAVTAFVLPTALLSAVSPMAAKLRLASTTRTGTVIGGLSAAGTAGALVGTFATGFVLVAAWPTRTIVVAIGVALTAAGIVVAIVLRRRPRPTVLTALLVAPALAYATPYPCEEQTRYYCVDVVVDAVRPSGRTLVLDNLRHSYVDLDDPTYLEFRYARLFAAAIDANTDSGAIDAVHIGGGGFTFPRWLEATRPGSTSTVLELDPDIVRIARAELGLETSPRLQVRTGDARINIGTEPTDAYDLALGDAFGGLSVPWHLTTVEMIREIQRVLRPDGVYVLNVIDGGPRGLVRAELATLSAVFEHVAVIAPPDGPAGNHVLVAGDRPLRLDSVDSADGVVLTGSDVSDLVDGADVLTDDKAPADQLLTRS